MKKIIYLLMLLAFACQSEGIPREYNKWYVYNGVLSVVTQKEEGNPVLVSLYKNSFLVVSYIDAGICDKKQETSLKIGTQNVAANYICADLTTASHINTYRITQPAIVTDVYNLLAQERTVVLQDQIKIWAENIKFPIDGVAPSL